MSTPPFLVTVTDSLELLAPGVELLRAEGIAVRELEPGEESLAAAQRARDSDALLVGVMTFGEGELGMLEKGRTKLIVRAGIGYDNVDVDVAHDLGIEVSNVPDYCVDEVADHTVLLLLAAERRLITVRDLGISNWSVASRLPEVHRLRNRILGIIGFGRIGRGVAQRAAAFGYRIIASDPEVADDAFEALGIERVELDELFRAADAVTLHCPLSPATEKLIDARRLALMKRGGVLVNTSRGGLVDLDAVDDALASGVLSSVALDVLDGEPNPPLDHPLLRRSNALITPHVAWYSLEARRDLAIKAAEEILRLVRGEPLRNALR